MLSRLANPAARFIFILFALVFSIRNALAAHHAGLGTSAGYERATHLEPGKIENCYLCGRYWQHTLEEPNPAHAVNDCRTALSLNLQSWLDLGTLYESEGTASQTPGMLSSKPGAPALHHSLILHSPASSKP